MRLSGNIVLIALAALTVWPARALAQAAGTARPVKPVPLNRKSLSVDDVPASFYVLFGGAAVGSGLPGADPSTVNVTQMDRTLKDVTMLNIPVERFVSLGGLVTNGVDDGGTTVSSRLNLWSSFFRERTKTALQAVLGGEAGGIGDQYDPAAAESWRTWLSKTGAVYVDTPGTRSDFSYTFGKDRFIQIDGDAKGPNLTWLLKELAQSETDKPVERVFVFGALPLIAPSGASLSGPALAFASRPEAASVRTALAKSKKVVAYFCGSPATFEVTPLEPGAKVNQVVIGNAGGPLDPSCKSYGFTLLVLYAGGTVSIVPFQRSAPAADQPFYAATPVAPTAAVATNEIVLWRRSR